MAKVEAEHQASVKSEIRTPTNGEKAFSSISQNSDKKVIENEMLGPNPEVARGDGCKKSRDSDILIVDADRKLSDIRQGQKTLRLRQNGRQSKPESIEDDLKCDEQFAVSSIL